MSKKYEITLPVPPSINRMYRVFRGRVFMVKEGRDYKAEVGRLIQEKFGQLTPFKGPVSVLVKVYRPAKRGDLDNFMKCLMDAMQGLFYKNDSQIVKLFAFRFDDKVSPRVEVIIHGRS